MNFVSDKNEPGPAKNCEGRFTLSGNNFTLDNFLIHSIAFDVPRQFYGIRIDRDMEI